MKNSPRTGLVETFTIQGEIDMNTSPIIWKHLTDLLKKNPKAIIVDLSKVSFIDSFGLAPLVAGLQWSQDDNTKFRLTRLTPVVKDVFKLAELLNVFEIFDSKEDVLKGI